jgi:sulfate adenylyltransferase large subunit
MALHIGADSVDLLRVALIGNVDDGKSTLIGRLLYDAGAILEDQLEELRRSSGRRGESGVNLSLLTDGLQAERDQGITIDIAHRYFSTARRSFIMIDCPGHFQYTRNMVTGCSRADAVVVLVDATRGVTDQTRRHLTLAALLGVRHFVLSINKMDQVDFSQERFEKLRSELLKITGGLGVSDIHAVPVCALEGDHVVRGSTRMEWYKNGSVLTLLEGFQLQEAATTGGFRFPVQRVIRPDALRYPRFRGYAGKLADGTIRVGDEVLVAVSGLRSRVAGIHTLDDPSLSSAVRGQSVTLTLEDEIDIGRGDLLVGSRHAPLVASEVEVTMCWLATQPSKPSQTYWFKHMHQYYQAKISICGDRDPEFIMNMNEIADVRLKASRPFAFDPFKEASATGALIVIDPHTHQTVGAAMIRKNIVRDEFRL